MIFVYQGMKWYSCLGDPTIDAVHDLSVGDSMHHAWDRVNFMGDPPPCPGTLETHKDFYQIKHIIRTYIDRK